MIAIDVLEYMKKAWSQHDRYFLADYKDRISCIENGKRVIGIVLDDIAYIQTEENGHYGVHCGYLFNPSLPERKIYNRYNDMESNQNVSVAAGLSIAKSIINDNVDISDGKTVLNIGAALFKIERRINRYQKAMTKMEVLTCLQKVKLAGGSHFLVDMESAHFPSNDWRVVGIFLNDTVVLETVDGKRIDVMPCQLYNPRLPDGRSFND